MGLRHHRNAANQVREPGLAAIHSLSLPHFSVKSKTIVIRRDFFGSVFTSSMFSTIS